MKYFGGGGGGGGGAVSSVFGRIGAVVAAAGDYAASLVSNDSSVSGSTIKDALNTLETAIAGLVTGVSSVFGRTGAVTAAASDYNASQIDNDSTVPGAFVDDALNTLSTITPTPIATGSNITGSGTVTITPGDDFGRYVITSLSADMELHLAVTGVSALQGLCIERTDTSAHTVTVVNDGPAGPGGPVGGPNLYVFPGSVKRSSSFIFDSADWSQGINLPLA